MESGTTSSCCFKCDTDILLDSQPWITHWDYLSQWTILLLHCSWRCPTLWSLQLLCHCHLCWCHLHWSCLQCTQSSAQQDATFSAEHWQSGVFSHLFIRDAIYWDNCSEYLFCGELLSAFHYCQWEGGDCVQCHHVSCYIVHMCTYSSFPQYMDIGCIVCQLLWGLSCNQLHTEGEKSIIQLINRSNLIQYFHQRQQFVGKLYLWVQHHCLKHHWQCFY